MKLHELTGELLALADSENIPEDALSDTLDSIQLSFNEKAIKISEWAMDIGGDIEKIDRRIQQLKERKESITKRKESLINYLRKNMEATGISKIECPYFSISLQKGRESVHVLDESMLDDEYIKVKTEVSPDKIAIAKAIKDGKEVAGAVMQRGDSIIKIK